MKSEVFTYDQLSNMVYNNDIDGVRYAIKEMGEKNVAETMADNQTLLFDVRSAKMAQLLLEIGTDPNIKGVWNITALHKVKSVALAEVLIDNGADMTAQNDYGETPAEWARQGGYPNVAEYIENRLEEQKKRDMSRDTEINDFSENPRSL